MTDSRQRFDTASVHAGQAVDEATGARAPPIYQSTSFVFDSADDAAARYALESDEHVYSRISNPTTRSLEHRITDLHDAGGAVATATGLAALDAATFVLAEPDSNIVTSSVIYGGTATYFRHAAEKRGIEPRFVDPLDTGAVAAAIDRKTAYLHVETIGNPALVTPDFEALARIAHDNDTPLFVDNTFASPWLCRPLEHGADLVWESTTKWIHGAGTTVGGVLVDGGSFDWSAGSYPELAEPNRAYPEKTFATDFAAAPVAAAARFRSLRSLGAAQSPFDAWVTLQGLETLPLRMERHCENAAIVAEYLADHPEVGWVNYPGLGGHNTHENARQYLDGGYGGMISFGLADGFEPGKRLCEETEVFSFLANVGDAKSLIIHPASTTHGQLSAEEQRESGVSRDLIRLSIGIEDPADLLADLDRAIDRAVDG